MSTCPQYGTTASRVSITESKERADSLEVSNLVSLVDSERVQFELIRYGTAPYGPYVLPTIVTERHI